ncbi:hypothetical protein RCL1_001968 [Eukaryota sp. TZLM3-RCL]
MSSMLLLILILITLLQRTYRAIKLYEDEVKHTTSLEQEITLAQKEVSELEEQIKQIQYSFSKLNKYKRFLKTTCDFAPADFSSTNDVMDRLSSLQQVNDQLNNQQNYGLSNVDILSSPTTGDSQLHVDNQSNKLKVRLEQLKSQSEMIEAQIIDNQRRSQVQLSETSRLSLAISDILLRIYSIPLSLTPTTSSCVTDKLNSLKSQLKALMDIKALCD